MVFMCSSVRWTGLVGQGTQLQRDRMDILRPGASCFDALLYIPSGPRDFVTSSVQPRNDDTAKSCDPARAL